MRPLFIVSSSGCIPRLSPKGGKPQAEDMPCASNAIAENLYLKREEDRLRTAV